MRDTDTLTEAELRSLMHVDLGAYPLDAYDRFVVEVRAMDDGELTSTHDKLFTVRGILGVSLDGDAVSVCDELACIMSLLPSVLRDRYGSFGNHILLDYALLAYAVDDEYTRRQNAASGHGDNSQEVKHGEA